LPGWDVHLYIDRVFFGKSYYKIHRQIDWPFKIVGKDHRRFFHDPLSARIIAETCYPGDESAVLAAYGHIVLDKFCTENPEYMKILEKLAILDKAKRRRGKKNTKRTFTKDDPFLSDLRKFSELKRLMDHYFSHG
jgi:hypothetical protein